MPNWRRISLAGFGEYAAGSWYDPNPTEEEVGLAGLLQFAEIRDKLEAGGISIEQCGRDSMSGTWAMNIACPPRGTKAAISGTAEQIIYTIPYIVATYGIDRPGPALEHARQYIAGTKGLN
jgi:hypothetical protein